MVELHMLPIEAGDATLLIDRSHEHSYTVLIDAGLAEEETVSYLQSIGVFHLDLIILSHPDLDHLKGLLAIIDNPLISIDQVWCFDLAFLRDFVTTGKIPRPMKPTHKIIYFYLLKTLVGMDKVLKTLGKKKVLTLQVSEGHKINVGSFYIEVLYPWDGFYRALHSPAQIKKLLSKKWPEDWIPPVWMQDNIENHRPARAQKITRLQEKEPLNGLLEGLDREVLENRTLPLMNPDEEEELEYEDEELFENDECLPISKIGTLYNNLSIVTKIHILGGINPPTLLFPGDLSDWTYLISRRFHDLSSDIFKYPHHGSSYTGVSRKALRSFTHFFPKHCPCGPWCFPECFELCYEYWHHMEKRIASHDTLRLFNEIVKPKHILLFPYPTQQLPPKGLFYKFKDQIHSNRTNPDPDHLSDPSNQAIPHIMRIGKESNDIETLSAGNMT